MSLLLVLLLQPASAPTTAEAPTSQPMVRPQPASTVAVKGAKTIHRGEAFTLKETQPFDAMMASAGTLDGKTVRVGGTVKAVCRKKGCWMTLSGTEGTSVARITFKDYGFFVPLDCSGSTASVEGVVKLKTLSEGERAHLAKDAGKDVKDVPKHEVRIVATAVSLVRP